MQSAMRVGKMFSQSAPAETIPVTTAVRLTPDFILRIFRMLILFSPDIMGAQIFSRSLTAQNTAMFPDMTMSDTTGAVF